jgi:cysteine synthase A
MPESWVHTAIHRIEADFNRSADTHLIHLPIASCPGVDLYLKDESVHPSGSLKHRLARSLFLYALCNGWVCEGTPIVEASSGSTAISEAYFARLLDLPFHAVVPCTTSAEKISKIEFLGGTCHPCQPSDLYSVAESLAQELNGHYMDQFKYAERATDWRGNNNIAESLFTQMALERFSEPTWIVVGAGTGGTSATIGRYIRYERRSTQLCVVDPENSVFEEYFRSGNLGATCSQPSRIEGDWPAQGGSVLYSVRGGSNDDGSRRSLHRHRSTFRGPNNATLWCIHRYEFVGGFSSYVGDAPARKVRQRRYADLR